jgi:hypothetical protein
MSQIVSVTPSSLPLMQPGESRNVAVVVDGVPEPVTGSGSFTDSEGQTWGIVVSTNAPELQAIIGGTEALLAHQIRASIDAPFTVAVQSIVGNTVNFTVTAH